MTQAEAEMHSCRYELVTRTSRSHKKLERAKPSGTFVLDFWDSEPQKDNFL